MIERHHQFERTLLPELTLPGDWSMAALMRYRRLEPMLEQLGIVYDCVQQEPEALHPFMRPGQAEGETEVAIGSHHKLVLPDTFYDVMDGVLRIENTTSAQTYRWAHHVRIGSDFVESRMSLPHGESVQTMAEFQAGTEESYRHLMPTELKARAAYRFVTHQLMVE